MSKDDAIRKVNQFKAETGSGRWAHLQRAAVADGLIQRIYNPDLIAQQFTPLCGPAAVVRAIARDNPVQYATAAIDLFKTGQARIGSLTITPGSELLRDLPEGQTDQSDWIMLASIRDSDNWFFSTSGVLSSSLAGVTRPGTIVKWFRDAGYSSVIENTYIALRPMTQILASWLDQASRLFGQGYYVVLVVDSDVLKAKNQDDVLSMYPDHWIVLRSAVRDGGVTNYDAPIQFNAWSWGMPITVPQFAYKPLAKSDFLTKFYGFVAARR